MLPERGKYLERGLSVTDKVIVIVCYVGEGKGKRTAACRAVQARSLHGDLSACLAVLFCSRCDGGGETGLSSLV